jgi:hypothetical protein
VTALGERLNDPDSPLVRDALTRKCRICKAKPGDDCKAMPIRYGPLKGRLVHHERTAP